MTTSTPQFLRAALAALACVLGLLVTNAGFAAEAKKSFDIPAGAALPALKLFAAQSGEQLLYSAEAVQDVTTNAIKGTFTPREALDRMTSGTKLMVVADRKNGALSLVRVPGPNAPRAAQTDSDRPEKAKVEDGKLVLDKYEVSGRKIDGILNKSLIPTEENAALYHEVISRAEIERLGATSFEELMRYIPQTNTGANGFQTPPDNVQFSGGTVANISRVGLRGFAMAQTLILINGRVQPRSGTSIQGGADLSRIPIAAIERVEILPLSGSALYGGGAVGGAINVVLRKEFSAKELTTYIGTSWDGGATEYRVSYLDGRVSEVFGRKTNLTVLLDYSHRDPLYQHQRKFLDKVLEKYGPTTTIVNPTTKVSAFETFTLNAFAGSRATILVGNSPTAAVNDLGIPGAPGVRFAMIPTGTAAAGSTALTPSSFTATAGQFTPGERFARQSIYQPQDNYSANLQLEHALNNRLTLYAEAGAIVFRSKYSFPQSLAVSLSATDPLNPFRTNVTPGFVGRPVQVFFDAADIPDPSVLEQRETLRGLLGVRGGFFDKWEWSLDGAYDYNHTFTGSNNTVNLLPSLLSLAGLTGTDPVTGQPRTPAPVDVRRAVYPLFADHAQFPVPASDTDKYWYSLRNSGSVTRNFIGIGRVTGPVYELPAGSINVAALGEYTDFDQVSGQSFDDPDALHQLLSGFPFRPTPAAIPSARQTVAGAMEVVLPLFNDKWRPRFIPLESMELNLGGREEEFRSEFISTTGIFSADRKRGRSYVAATKVKITQDLAVRYSYSTGVYPPGWSDFGGRNVILNFQAVPDPKRGNTSQPAGTYNVATGGNPALRSESSTSRNLGLIFTPRFLPGLSLNVDYWKIAKKDGIAFISVPALLAREEDYPGRIQRAALTPADAALGYTGGLITFADMTRINLARIETEGVDVQLRYERPTDSMGTFSFSANSTFTNNFLSQATPVSPIIDTAGVTGPRRWRGRAAITWSRDPWEITFSSRYTAHYSTTTTTPTSAIPSAIPYDGESIPSVLRYDAQVSYRFKPDTTRRDWRRWLSATKFTLGCQNLLNREPALVSNGTSFYNVEDDPRQRFIYLSIKKSL